MSKVIFSLFASLFIAAPVAAIENGDTVYVDYDLQGGVNNPDNIAFYIYDASNREQYPLLPPTKEGAEFLGWYTTDKTPLTSHYKRDSFYPYEKPNQGNKLKIHARWGVISKRPQMDDAGCMLVHDAAELYGAVKIADSTLKKVCIFIENDIVVNKNVLKSDGSANSGDFYWWKPFRYFVGIIEGNGHTISGLYGNVGLIQQVQEYNTVIQNLGITDSYFSGENAGSFVSTVEFGGLKLKNVFSSASVRSTSGYVGGLVGSINSFGDLCLDPAFPPLPAPSPEPDRNPSAYEFMGKSPDFFSQIENSYSTGYLMGKEGGGLVGAVDNVSFKIPYGSTPAILGGTGSGKSTLMMLLDKMYLLGEGQGRIRIGDTDINEISTTYLRSNIGFVLQEPFLFSRSISENIGITAEKIDIETIREAAGIAALDDAVMSFSNGYDTFVGERGVTLSGGQKQRVAIARMLTQKTPIMIFDDSFSAIDTETDAKIRNALEKRFGTGIIILISHRISTLSKADNILVLEHGTISEQGSHDELIHSGGLYQKIYDIQSGAEEAILNDER